MQTNEGGRRRRKTRGKKRGFRIDGGQNRRGRGKGRTVAMEWGKKEGKKEFNEPPLFPFQFHTFHSAPLSFLAGQKEEERGGIRNF